MDGAGAALGDAAAIFGAGQADLIAEHPQQGRFGLDIELVARRLRVNTIVMAWSPKQGEFGDTWILAVGRRDIQCLFRHYNMDRAGDSDPAKQVRAQV